MDRISIRRKLLHEGKYFLGLSAYLYVCFGCVLIYTSAVLRDHGISYIPYGLAALKALIVAKFLLIGNELRFGNLFARTSPIYAIGAISIVYLFFLISLLIAEEIVSSYLSGNSVGDAVAVITVDWVQILTKILLMWLILLPIVTLQKINTILGSGILSELLFRGHMGPEAAKPAKTPRSGNPDEYDRSFQLDEKRGSRHS